MAPRSSSLAWKIPWTEESGRLQSIGSLRVRHDWATSLLLFTFMHWRRKWQPIHSSVLAWRIPGTGEPGGLPSLGSHRVGHDWSDLAAAAADCSPPGSSVHGILQARIVVWVGSYFPSPGHLPNPGIKPSLPHCRQILTIWVTREALRFKKPALLSPTLLRLSLCYCLKATL